MRTAWIATIVGLLLAPPSAMAQRRDVAPPNPFAAPARVPSNPFGEERRDPPPRGERAGPAARPPPRPSRVARPDRSARPAPAPRAPRAPARGATPLDRLQQDRDVDPISHVPDAQALTRDAAAERRAAEAEARRQREIDAEVLRAREAREAREAAEAARPAPVRAPRSVAPPRLGTPGASARAREAARPGVSTRSEHTERGAIVDHGAGPRRVEDLAAAALEADTPEADHHAIRFLDDVLERDGAAAAPPTPAGPEAAAAPAPPPSLVGGPSVAQVEAAIVGIEAALRACVSAGVGQPVRIRTIFAGATGRATMAIVEASSRHFTPQQRSCMARAARSARTEPFERATVEVAYELRF